MSEKDGYTPSDSGMLSRVRGPTIIGQKVPIMTASGTNDRKPTVIGTPVTEVPQRKPTVIGGQKVDTPHERPPTTMPATARPDPTAAPKPAAVVNKPSVMPGTVRTGVLVTLPELAKHFPGTSEEMLQHVHGLLKQTVIAVLTTAQCGTWGATEQQAYAKAVDRSLKLAKDKTVVDSARHLGRLFTLLQKLAQSFQKERGLLRFFQGDQSPLARIEEDQQEIDQLRSMLEQALPRLEAVCLELMEISATFGELALRIEARALAGQFVADLLEKEDGLKAQALQRQSMSLTQTIAHIQEGLVMRAASVEEVSALASKIREAVLVTLPAWLEKASLVSRRSVTETDIYELRQGIAAIILHLK